MKVFDVICAAAGAVGGAIAAAFGGWSHSLTTLLIVMGVDYITGLVVAGVFKKSTKTETGALESKAGWKGLIRKGATLLIVLVACRLDIELGTMYIRDSTFNNCINLTTISKLPENLLNMERTFSDCRNLTKAPEIPDGVINMEGAFIGSGIYKAPVLPDSVTNLNYTFFQCMNMSEVSKIPNGVVNMEGTFQGCESLTVTPEISDSVINMREAFKDCINLVKVSKISDNVTNLDYAFEGCTKLTAAPVIPDSVTSMYATFSGCRALTSVPSIPENVVNMTLTFDSCQNLTGEIVINANPKEYAGCFKWVYFENQNLTLSGSSSLLDELKSTGR